MLELRPRGAEISERLHKAIGQVVNECMQFQVDEGTRIKLEQIINPFVDRLREEIEALANN